MQEGVVPEGWTQNQHNAYWSGFHAGEAHANSVPRWVECYPGLTHQWLHGYADGEVSHALGLS